LKRRLLSLWRDDSGHALLLLSMSLPPILVIAGLAVDLGSIYWNTRRLQGAADFAAIAAVEQLQSAQAGATEAAAANGYQANTVTSVELGTYIADRATAVGQRFQLTTGTPNAVRVTMEAVVPMIFGAIYGGKTTKIRRTALASSDAVVAFSLGTRIAGINSNMANAMLGGALGNPVSVSVVDYNGLASAKINMLDLVVTLQNDLNLRGQALNDTLAADVPLRDVLNALAGVLATGGDNLNAGIVRGLATATASDRTIQLNKLLNLGTAGSSAQAPSSPVVSVPVFDLIRELAVSSTGQSSIAFNFNTSVAGIQSTSLKVSIGTRMVSTPWMTLTNSHSFVLRTSQARVMLDSTVAPVAIVPGLASVRVPIVVELGSAQAKLNNLSCAGGSNSRHVAIDVAPSIGQGAIADLVNPQDFYDHTRDLQFKPAAVASIPLVSISGYSHLDFSDNAWQTLNFNEHDIATNAVKTVHSSGTITALVSSLVNNLQLQSQVAGFSLLAPSLSSVTNNSILAATPALDSLLFSLTDTLGIGLGEADVMINGVNCGAPRLVG
jgi:uncharacterized membrane protein